MEINSDYNDLLRFLNDAGVRYLIAGGYAVMKYTEPMWTKDIDIWIDPNFENAAKTYEALRRFGAPLGDLTIEDMTDPTAIFQIGVYSNRIDIMTSVPGLRFEEAWEHRDVFQLGEVPAPVISMDDTLRAARESNRPKDRLRIKALEKAKKIRSRLNE